MEESKKEFKWNRLRLDHSGLTAARVGAIAFARAGRGVASVMSVGSDPAKQSICRAHPGKQRRASAVTATTRSPRQSAWHRKSRNVLPVRKSRPDRIHGC